MAAYYQRRKKHTGRNLLIFVLLVLAAVFIWRQWFYTPASDNSNPIDTPPSPTGLNVEDMNETSEAATSTSSNVDAPPAINHTVASQPQPTSIAPNVTTRAQELLAEGCSNFAAGDIIAARRKLTLAVESGLEDSENKQARDLLNQAADKWLFSRNVFENDPHCERFLVPARDDILLVLRKQYLVPENFICSINNLRPDRIPAGGTIKVVKGPFRCIVERSKFRMTVYLGDVIVRTYTVTVGAPGQETPTGLWKVTKKQFNPAWTDPQTGKHYLPDDPDNPLGEHWIAMEGIEGDAVGRTGFGIHGTNKPDAIGKAASHGCIRLHNGQAEELYNMLLEGHSTVRVAE
ncbi:MAG: L,D-transpeptidase family protein [Sedimentisphaerales bacterium]|nr:L,D-transpeptidase family protein [Sedimentisphaerales bacterium]